MSESRAAHGMVLGGLIRFLIDPQSSAAVSTFSFFAGIWGILDAGFWSLGLG